LTSPRDLNFIRELYIGVYTIYNMHSIWERKLYSIRDSMTINENRANFLRQLRHPCNDVRKVHVRNSGSRKHTKTLPKREITERDIARRISRKRWNWPGSLNTISWRIEAPMEIRILLRQESTYTHHACRTRRVNRTRDSDVISLHVTRRSRSFLDLLCFDREANLVSALCMMRRELNLISRNRILFRRNKKESSLRNKYFFD